MPPRRATSGSTGPAPDAIADVFVRFLSEDSEHLCSPVFLGCMAILEQGHNLEKLRHERHDLFICILKFFTTTRTSSQLDQLREKVVPCQCSAATKVSSPVMKDLHRIAFVKPEVSADRFLTRLSTFLCDCILRKSKLGATKSAPFKNAALTGVAWPEQTTDLFVRPPNEMFASAWQFYDAYPLNQILSFLNLLVAFGGTSITMAIYTIPTFPADVCRHWQRLLDVVFAGDLEGMAFNMMVDIVITVLTKCGGTREASLFFWRSKANDLLTLITQSLDKLSTTRIRRSSGVEHDVLVKKLTDLGETVLGRYNNPAFPEIQKNAHLCHKSFRDKCRTPSLEEILKESRAASLEPYTWAFDHVRVLAQTVQCGRADCKETCSTRGKRFPACSRCNIVGYCSKECQAASWKQHKLLCPILGAYTRKIPVDWRRTGDSKSLRTDVQKMSVEAGVTREEAEKIIEGSEPGRAYKGLAGLANNLEMVQALLGKLPVGM